MSERITKKHIENLMPFFAETFGFHLAKDYKDIGGLRIDNNPTYGGMVIEAIHNESGAVTRPLGNSRYSPKELYYMMHFAIDCKYASDRLKDKS